MNRKKVIISGGGTGGHVFPAIAIANALKQEQPDIDILFVGAKGKIEMEKVPVAGYPIKALPVQGLQRKFTLKNIQVLFNFIKSIFLSRKIIKNFKPDIVVGVGGFASAPVGWLAGKMGIPVLLQEQNSYAGVTNKLLAKYAHKICVAYDNMERYFPIEKIIKTGNPVRQNLFENKPNKSEALAHFSLKKELKTILILGGSGGARSINEGVIAGLKKIKNTNIQLLWQTGKFYYEQSNDALNKTGVENCKIHDFISRMDNAYTAADLVISRAGAATISELCLLGKASILIPSPNVAEDHQTKNAMALVEKNAAVLIKDTDTKEKMISTALDLIINEERINELSLNASKLGIKNSDKIIAKEIFKIIS